MGETRDWVRGNWRTIVLLALILGVALFLRVFFVAGEFFPAGYWSGKGDYSGGSDPFYWERGMNYTYQTGKEISIDCAMNYPVCFPDVRPPLFNWFNLLVGYLIVPLFPGVFPSAWDAAVFMLNFNAALFGMLTIIPTYLLGKEAFGKRVGLIAALLLAVSAAALQRSRATIAVHDAWTLFFVVAAFYFYVRALKTLNRRRWVENWFQGAAVRKGVREFFQENRKSVLYALLAGMCVAVTALSWQGWAYVPVILVLIFLVELMLDRIRNQDTMGVTILFLLILATPLLVSFPWYFVRNLIRVWWDVPAYLFAAALILGIVFTVTRDYPWTIVIPATFTASGIAIAIASIVNPALLFAFYSGAGYFVKNKVYETIAEAQEPGMSELILAFGWFTFFIGLAAVALMMWQAPRRNNPAYTMLVFWTFGALFMALAAARFIFNAAPVFAVATAYGIDLILVRMDFAGMRRTYRSLAEGSRRNAFRKAVKIRHVVTILVLAFLVILPNTWFAVDAGIPFDQKAAYDKQINNMLPWFLQAPGYSQLGAGQTFYLGAFGYSLPKSTDYFPAGWSWLNQQDADLPQEQRPAFMSWWDYGFEASERGGHPVVADPFQNGFQIAGQFLLAQNESTAIALMTIRLIEGDHTAHGRHLSPQMVATLEGAGLPADSVEFAFSRPSSLVPIVLANPQIYGPWDSNMQSHNAQYIYLANLFLSYLDQDELVGLYHRIQQVTGTSIAYFMVDTRLFPLSATNTGIFYAPAKLSDRRVINLLTGQVMPQDFFQIFANTNRGTHLPIQILGPADTIQSTTIEYQAMFYNSMFYRAYVGYAPTDLGVANNTGIPGFDQALAAYPPVPAWNMSHWRVVYRTAYYNPYPDPANHTGAWQAMNYEDALDLQRKIQAGEATGVVDLSTQASITNGLVMLRYYDGAWVNGTVAVDGVPLPGAWITLTDELGTPHYLTKTDAQGRYSSLAPFGSITLSVTSGTLTRTTLLGQNTLAQTTFPVTLAQALRADEDLNGDGIPDWRIEKDIALSPLTVSGHVYFDFNGNAAFDAESDAPAAGAVVTIQHRDLAFTRTVTTDFQGGYTAGRIGPGTYLVDVSYRGHTIRAQALTVSSQATSGQDIPIPFLPVQGTVRDPDGAPAADATVTLADALNGSAWSARTGAAGAFTFTPVMYGDYNLTAASGVFATLPTPLTVESGTPATNLTLTASGRVVGTTILNGASTGHLLLRFQSESNPNLMVSVASDAAGAFNVSLPTGAWDVNGRVYSDANLYAFLGRVTVTAGGTTALAASFQPGGAVQGTVTGTGGTGQSDALLIFQGVAGTVWARSGTTGAYTVFLPLGSYDVQVKGTDSTAFASLDLTWSRTFDPVLSPGTGVSGTVYWDKDGNGVTDPGEGIEGARIELMDDEGHRLLVVTNTTGSFDLLGFDNRTYAGTITADGFVPESIGPTALAEIGPNVRYALEPISVSVTGRVLLNGTPLLNRVVTVSAVAESTSARSTSVTSFSDGSYSLSLVPGAYRLVVDENASATNATRYQNLATDALLLGIGEGARTYDLSIAFRTLVRGNVTLNGVAGVANLTFTGPDRVNASATARGFQVYLQPGSYSVGASRTVSDVVHGALVNVTLPVSGNLSLVLIRTARVTGQVLYGSSSVTVTASLTFARLEGGTFLATVGSGSYVANLVAGNYTVTLNATSSESSGGVPRFYRYTFLGSLTIPPGATTLTYAVHLNRSLDNTTASGLVRFAGEGVDASLSFIATSGGALDATVAVPSSGAYTVSLAPGTYVVYATRGLPEAAFLGPLTVPHTSALTFDVSLAPAFRLSGVTTDDRGARVAANLTIQGAASLARASDANGVYAVTLPARTYVVTASRSAQDRGLRVQYTAATQVSLTTDAVANLALQKVVARDVALSWDASQNRTIVPGGTVTYTFTAMNIGNVADTFQFSGRTTGWTFTFSPPSVSLGYGVGGNATLASVTIQAPQDAQVDHSPIVIAATSTESATTSGTLTLTVGIARLRSLTLTVAANSGTFDGRYLNYTANVRNAGNAPEIVTVAIGNPSDLGASGWVARIGKSGATPTGTTITDLSIGANSSAQVRISLQQAGGASGITVVLQATAQDNPAVSASTTATLVLPQLEGTTGVGVAGPNATKVLPLNLELIAIVVGAASAVAAGLFLTRRRR